MTTRDDLQSLVNRITFSAARGRGGVDDDDDEKRPGEPRRHRARSFHDDDSSRKKERERVDDARDGAKDEPFPRDKEPDLTSFAWEGPKREEKESVAKGSAMQDFSDKESVDTSTYSDMQDVFQRDRGEDPFGKRKSDRGVRAVTSRSRVGGVSWGTETEAPKVETAITVVDDGASVGTYNSTGDTKKYKLFCIGPDYERAQGVCGVLFGQGVTFCMGIGCATKHRSKERFEVRRNGVYVQAGVPNRAYCHPNTSSANLEDKIMRSWLAEAQTMTEWSRMFRLAERAEFEKPLDKDVTVKDLREEEVETNKAREMKTPLRGGRLPPPDPSPFDKYVEVDQALSGLTWDPINPQPLPYFNHFDRACAKLSNDLEKLREVQQNADEFFRSLATNHELRFEDINDSIGTRPLSLDTNLDAPSLWGAVGNLGTSINESADSSNKAILLLTRKFDDLLKGHRVDIQQDIRSYVKPLEDDLNNLTGAFTTVSGSLKAGIDYNLDKLQELKRDQRAADTVDSSELGDLIRSLTDRIESLESTVLQLQDNVEGAIKFHDLGFKSYEEGRAWLETYCPDAHFGFLMDFATAMEHIQRQINGKEQLKTMHDYFKLKFMTTNAEAVAISSFEYTTPRFFCETGGHKVHTPTMSFFSEIKGYDQWSDPLDGFKQRWKLELVQFKKAHMTTIGDATHLNTAVKTMCKVSLTTTVGWSLGLIDFIDNTYETYSQGKFGSKKAWHIASKLALCLIKEITRPRIGAINSFVAGKQDVVAAHIFWRTLQSLDKMSEIEQLDFENHPAISTELVKFLSMHTSVEAVEKLQTQHTDMTADMKDLRKEVGLAAKNSSTNGNKVTEFGPKLTALLKRVEKLEKKAE